MNVDDERHPKGRLREEKEGETSEPGSPQPEMAEVESARLLANEARPALEDAGFPDDRIRELADEYIALDLGEATDEFVAWAKKQGP